MSASVLAFVLLATPQAADQRAEAERLARSGSHARALQQFQAIAAANPDDLEARLWIARLHLWMGHPERAADVYQSVTVAAPRNIDALIGLGTALTSSGRLVAAADALNRAEAIAPDRADVLSEQARLHSAWGHGTLALAYYERALAIDPANAEAREAYEAMRARRAHRIEGTYYFEHFNDDTPDSHSGVLAVNARVNDQVRLFVEGQHLRKFSLDEDRFGGGIEWLAHRNLSVRAGGLFANDTRVLPDADVNVDVACRAARITWLGGVRYLHFDTTSSVVLSPGVTYSPRDGVAVTLRYHRSQTDLPTALDSLGNNGFSALATARAARRAWVFGGYTRGFEGLSNVTAEYLTMLDGDSVTGGVRVDVAPMTSLAATFEHQWRDDSVRVARLFVTFVQRF